MLWATMLILIYIAFDPCARNRHKQHASECMLHSKNMYSFRDCWRISWQIFDNFLKTNLLGDASAYWIRWHRSIHSAVASFLKAFCWPLHGAGSTKKAVSAPPKKSLHYCGMLWWCTCQRSRTWTRAIWRRKLGLWGVQPQLRLCPACRKGHRHHSLHLQKKANTKHSQLSFRLETEVRTNCSRTSRVETNTQKIVLVCTCMVWCSFSRNYLLIVEILPRYLPLSITKRQIGGKWSVAYSTPFGNNERLKKSRGLRYTIWTNPHDMQMHATSNAEQGTALWNCLLGNWRSSKQFNLYLIPQGKLHKSTPPGTSGCATAERNSVGTLFSEWVPVLWIHVGWFIALFILSWSSFCRRSLRRLCYIGG